MRKRQQEAEELRQKQLEQQQSKQSSQEDDLYQVGFGNFGSYYVFKSVLK